MDTSKPETERSATDDRIAENQAPAAVAPATRDAGDTESSGLPTGVSDDLRSPLDSVFYDPKKPHPKPL